MRYKRMWGQEAQKDTFTFEEFLAAQVTVSWAAGNPYGSSGWEFGPYQTFKMGFTSGNQ